MPDMDQGSGLDRGNLSQGADTGNEAAGNSFVTGLPKETGSGQAAASQPPAQDDKSAQEKESEQPTGVLPGFAQALTKTLKTDPKVAAFTGKFKALDDLVKSAMEADSKLGGMVAIPREDAPEAERQAFYAKLGVPTKPEDYKLTTDGKNLTDSDLAEYRTLAHKMNLTQKQAQAFVDAASKTAQDLTEGYKAKMVEAAKATESALKQEWGEKYQQNYSIMQRGWRAFGNQDLARELDSSGLGNSPAIAKLLLKLGTLVQEDSGAPGMPKSIQKAGTGVDRPGLE